MSNLLHVFAVDRAVEQGAYSEADEVLQSGRLRSVVDTFENERHFYDVMGFLRTYFPTDLFELVTSYGEREQPVHPNLELLRTDGWYVTVLDAEQYMTFRDAVVRALEHRPWREEVVAPAADVAAQRPRSFWERLRGKPVETPPAAPAKTYLEHDDYPWNQFADSQVTGDYYIITSTM